ncbi:hypothetical protein GGD64_007136 [Bradyrhizobium sp. CIR3A]|nr:hypothetical protein [Bradyrhizobium sp. CIR3A]
MNRQSQGRRALRVRREGLRRHQQSLRSGRPVRAARERNARPYDGHPCGKSSSAPRRFTRCPIERAYVDKGYRGDDAQNHRRVFISGQKRGVFGVIKRELRRRSAIEPIIGHMKAEGDLGRCYLKGRAGDAANVVLSAIGHNFRRILAGLKNSWASSWSCQ